MSQQKQEKQGQKRSERFDILVIEDNPSDARLIEHRLTRMDELAKRIGSNGNQRLEIAHKQRLAAGETYLRTSAVDLILLDLNLPDSEGLATLDQLLLVTDDVPIIVLTGVQDQHVGFEAIERGAQEYLIKDEVTDELLMRSIHHAVIKHRQERERKQRQAQLEAINRLNTISQDLTHLVITTGTREELEQRVCDRLVESDGYALAWIGDLTGGTHQVAPKRFAGASEDVVKAVAESLKRDESHECPFDQAIETRQAETAVIPEDEWEYPEACAYRSVIVVPIVHREVTYGVLSIYDTDPNAFTDPERAILDGVGTMIGHAIAALKRKDALVGDSTLELEFQLEGHAQALRQLTNQGGSMQFAHLVRSDGALLAYGSVTDIERERFLQGVEESTWVTHACVLTEGEQAYDFELRTAEFISLFEMIANYGGRMKSGIIVDGEARFVIEASHGIETRKLIEAIESDATGISYVAQRTTTEPSQLNSHSVFEQDLTKKQRQALETAVFAGYFDWPRRTTGEEIADQLGVSAATFAQHLRAAERKFFERVFNR